MKKIVFIYLLAFGFCQLTISQSLPSAPSLSESFNQLSSIGFNYGGNTISKGKSYYNSMGKQLQSHSWDVLTDKVWAGVTLYDRHGRGVFHTLNAPIGTQMLYSTNFIKDGSGGDYTFADFDVGTYIDNPSTVNTSSSLGNYYSTANSINEYQDITSYPFVRVVYSKLNPGSQHQVLGGNKADGEWKQSYTFSMPSVTELSYEFAFGGSWDTDTKVTKTVTRDVHGEDVVVFTDTDGNVLAAARSGISTFSPAEYLSEFEIGAQGYIDIHIPKIGTPGFTITNPALSVSGPLKIYDLIEETFLETVNVPLSNQSRPSGFYRISVSNVEAYAEYVKEGIGSLIEVSHMVNYYQYSLNYYDKTGRMVKNVQPMGGESTFLYNSLGQLLEASSPDEGTSEFLYRKDGQIRFSQNSEQAKNGEFSYTHYDIYGRPIESGVYEGSITFTQAKEMVDDPDPFNPADCRERHLTTYDFPTYISDITPIGACSATMLAYKQYFVAGNVSKTTTLSPHTTTTWYSYDSFGRLVWMVQRVEGMSCYKTIDYTYDPETGLLIKVDYQKNTVSERFVHKYDYNEAGQLVLVSTSKDNTAYKEQAAYTYAETGELVRTLLAEDLQGIDYVYNLGGQLKAINHPSLDPDKDPGQDGTMGSSVAADVFCFAIDYYSGDYLRNNTPTPVPQQQSYGTNLYNGNIKGVRFNTSGQPGSSGQFHSYSYNYNKNHWITGANYGSGSETVLGGGNYGVSFTQNPNSDYRVSDVQYDANGNILALIRNGYTDFAGTNAMDEFYYYYDSEKKNRLLSVEDLNDNPNATRYDDLKDQYNYGVPNYFYNSIGQLITDVAGRMVYTYNASGLVTRVSTFAGSSASVQGIYWQDYEQSDDLSRWVTAGTKQLSSVYNPDGGGSSCTYLDNTYGRSLKISMANNETARRTFKAIPDAEHTLSLDIIADQWRESAPLGMTQTPVGYTLYIYDGDIGMGLFPLLATVNYNTGLSYINDPDLSGTVCKKFYDRSESLTFTPSGEVVSFMIRKHTTAGTEPLYLDSFVIQAATTPVMDIAYNDRGHRVKKTAYNLINDNKQHTYYIRDAAGTIMTVYSSLQTGVTEPAATRSEIPLYGLGRLGMLKPGSFTGGLGGTTDIYLYQLTDHLGNVRAVISKTGLGTPLVVSRTDYYPGGMAMPNRNVEGGYRYGYQGEYAEKDPETGLYAFELRLYDPRINRWISPDPMGEFHSPYLAMGNNWISLTDPTGGCTKCPKNAKQGDTFSHPEFGEMTYTEMGGWTDASGAGVLDDVMIFSVSKDATVKVLTETDGVGHTYIQIGNNIVFSNGRYNGSDSPSMGAYGVTNFVLTKKNVS